MEMDRTHHCECITTGVRKKDSSDTEMCVVFFILRKCTQRLKIWLQM